ncbi:DUF983 domain-containing protein [Oricola thermophila]|uniref:DUF983 domain-containing protein n=1 Tax=Oricola thermophila TaxID=2742145 RepID=A0A6N1VFG5_9HYPH|nr:DUF983 domain-containing protein [Oricola thermophila]QKV17982.1 DUF983 domain-containing protein [Oricola thermophila]
MSELTFLHDHDEPVRPKRPVFAAIKRGFAGKCPHCGEGRLFRAFVKPVDSCPVCDEDMTHQRADDFPAYLNVVIVGHVGVGGFTMAEAMTDLSGWVHLAIWIPIMLFMAVVLMQPLKGAVIGFQWANYMHGFGGEDDMPENHPEQGV